MRLDVFLGILLQFPSARYGLVELRLSNEETDEQRIYKVRPEGYFDGFERDFAHLIMCFRYHFDGFDGYLVIFSSERSCARIMEFLEMGVPTWSSELFAFLSIWEATTLFINLPTWKMDPHPPESHAAWVATFKPIRKSKGFLSHFFAERQTMLDFPICSPRLWSFWVWNPQNGPEFYLHFFAFNPPN